MKRLLKCNRFNAVVAGVYAIESYLVSHHHPNVLTTVEGVLVALPLGYFLASLLSFRERPLPTAVAFALAAGLFWTVSTVFVTFLLFPNVFDIRLGPCGF
jgi:hypothetical protein